MDSFWDFFGLEWVYIRNQIRGATFYTSEFSSSFSAPTFESTAHMLEASGLQQWKDQQHVSQGKGEEHHHALYHYTRVPGFNISHRLSKTTFVFDSLAGFERKIMENIYLQISEQAHEQLQDPGPESWHFLPSPRWLPCLGGCNCNPCWHIFSKK